MMARLGFVVLSLFLFSACGDQDQTAALPRPDAPPAKLLSFSGTLQPQATDTYTFTVSQSGYVQATLVGLAAPPSTQVAIGIGTPSTTGLCGVASSVNVTAGTSAQLIGTGIAGTLCITIRDIGNLTLPAIYTLTVAAS
jgi:hypothetical protein